MEAEITGKSTSHINFNKLNVPVHKDVVAPFRELQQLAKMQGFDLQIISGFRDYERQLKIWNEKVLGKRKILDEENNIIDPTKISTQELIFAILKYSALPGFSRHHWGSDMDVYDANACPEDYQVQLNADECSKKGIFGKLHQWLDDHLEHSLFFRPYENNQYLVSPERWHLSYRPVADQYLEHLSLDFFIEEIESSQILLKDEILKNAKDIYYGYVAASSNY